MNARITAAPLSVEIKGEASVVSEILFRDVKCGYSLHAARSMYLMRTRSRVRYNQPGQTGETIRACIPLTAGRTCGIGL